MTLDQAVLWFTLAACVIAGILFGLIPAMLVSCQDLSPAMKESGAGAQTGASSSRPPGYVIDLHWHRNSRDLGFSLDSARSPDELIAR